MISLKNADLTDAVETSTRSLAWQMIRSGEPLRIVEREIVSMAADEVLIRIAGCGICHTDLAYLDEGVRTRGELPLVLGHEISGYVEDAGTDFKPWIGKAVVVPAVIPCGGCADCSGGRANVCARQVMPGNDRDGGFANYVVLPGRGLCPVPGASTNPDAQLGDVPGLTLRHLAVVADAVSTAYQSVVRSGLSAGQLAIVVGTGGVGGYAVQIAAELGARVVALDVDSQRLESALGWGARSAIDVRGVAPKELRRRIGELARHEGASDRDWKIFECSGNPAGQSTAWSLLGPSATLLVVGYTRDEITVRLSNLMAFDARAIGNWGCSPEHYPAIVEKVLCGKYDIVRGTQIRPLSEIEAALDDVRQRRASKRIVLAPES